MNTPPGAPAPQPNGHSTIRTRVENDEKRFLGYLAELANLADTPPTLAARAALKRALELNVGRVKRVVHEFQDAEKQAIYLADVALGKIAAPASAAVFPTPGGALSAMSPSALAVQGAAPARPQALPTTPASVHYRADLNADGKTVNLFRISPDRPLGGRFAVEVPITGEFLRERPTLKAWGSNIKEVVLFLLRGSVSPMHLDLFNHYTPEHEREEVLLALTDLVATGAVEEGYAMLPDGHGGVAKIPQTDSFQLTKTYLASIGWSKTIREDAALTALPLDAGPGMGEVEPGVAGPKAP